VKERIAILPYFCHSPTLKKEVIWKIMLVCRMAGVVVKAFCYKLEDRGFEAL
jgi:hypothetical protein